MFIKPYIFFLRKGTKFCVLLHTLSGQEKNVHNLKRKRDLERVCHLGMSSRSVMNNGKEEPTRILKCKKGCF